MSIWGALTNSTTAMIAQNDALNTISQNITNSNTTAYKRIETHFSTMLSQSHGSGQNIFGVRGSVVTRVNSPGQVASTANPFDLALKEDGFFILNTEADGSGETTFSRDGAFTKKIVEGESNSYLVDRNGFFLQGWTTNPDGSVNSTALAGIQVPETMTVDGVATTELALKCNVPAGSGTPQSMKVTVYDADFTSRALSMNWTPAGTNAWSVAFSVEGGTVTSPAILDVTFDGAGNVISPSTSDLAITWDGGGTSTITLDLSGTTQFGGPLTVASDHNGLPQGYLDSTGFNGNGTLVGHFSNGRSISMYKLPLARFMAPDALEARAGNIYTATEGAGDYEILDVIGETTFAASSLESSNVDLAEEFTAMIMTQKAYSSAATVFRTVDEMTVLLRDLKT